MDQAEEVDTEWNEIAKSLCLPSIVDNTDMTASYQMVHVAKGSQPAWLLHDAHSGIHLIRGRWMAVTRLPRFNSCGPDLYKRLLLSQCDGIMDYSKILSWMETRYSSYKESWLTYGSNRGALLMPILMKDHHPEVCRISDHSIWAVKRM